MLRWIANGYRTGFPQSGRKPIKSPWDRGIVPLVIQSLWNFKMPSSQRARARECRRQAAYISSVAHGNPRVFFQLYLLFSEAQTHSLCPYHKCLLGLLKFYPVVDTWCLFVLLTMLHLVTWLGLGIFIETFSFPKFAIDSYIICRKMLWNHANDSVISVAPSNACVSDGPWALRRAVVSVSYISFLLYQQLYVLVFICFIRWFLVGF